MLLCLVSLAWFAVLAAAARVRRVQLPVTLLAVGVDDGAGLRGAVAHAVKWTHHFGALAGVGAAFLALCCAGSPCRRPVRRVRAGAVGPGRDRRGAGSYALADRAGPGTARTSGPTRGWTGCAGPPHPPARARRSAAPRLWCCCWPWSPGRCGGGPAGDPGSGGTRDPAASPCARRPSWRRPLVLDHRLHRRHFRLRRAPAPAPPGRPGWHDCGTREPVRCRRRGDRVLDTPAAVPLGGGARVAGAAAARSSPSGSGWLRRGQPAEGAPGRMWGSLVRPRRDAASAPGSGHHALVRVARTRRRTSGSR